MKQSQSAEKCKRPIGLFETPVCCKISKKLKRTLWTQKKVAQYKKNSKGDPLISSGFVSYIKKGVNERGTLCTNFDAFPVV